MPLPIPPASRVRRSASGNQQGSAISWLEGRFEAPCFWLGWDQCE